MKFMDRLRLAWGIVREDDTSHAMEHAERELFLLLGDTDDMNIAMSDNIKEMILVFTTQGHSGFSASYARSCLNKLLAFEPITPLTGEDSEWKDVSYHMGNKPYWQNIRCGRVFKDNTGAYDSTGKVFEEPDGCTFTSKESRVPITFPYTPKTEYVKVDKNI